MSIYLLINIDRRQEIGRERYATVTNSTSQNFRAWLQAITYSQKRQQGAKRHDPKDGVGNGIEASTVHSFFRGSEDHEGDCKPAIGNP